jgi:hypothetical protein
MSEQEKLPLPDIYRVIESITIFKSQKWWEAVVAIESFGRRSIAIYLWLNRNGTWKRKQKLQMRSVDEWNKVKNAVEQLMPKLQGEQKKSETIPAAGS